MNFRLTTQNGLSSIPAHATRILFEIIDRTIFSNKCLSILHRPQLRFGLPAPGATVNFQWIGKANLSFYLPKMESVVFSLTLLCAQQRPPVRVAPEARRFRDGGEGRFV